MLKNMASSLILTELEDDLASNKAKIKGRIVTTLPKAKELRYVVEKAITLARKALVHERAAKPLETTAQRNSEEWKAWRKSKKWQEWAKARAPYVRARNRAVQMLGNKQAVEILFNSLAPRFENRPGGYTRVLKLAKPRLGDNGQRAVIEFVGVNDRVVKKAARPSFDDVAKS